MTYIDHINRFWQVNKEQPFTLGESKVYLFLLYVAHTNDWPQYFQLSDVKAANYIGVSVNTYKTARAGLVSRNLIAFDGGHRGQHNMGKYQILTLNIENYQNLTLNDAGNCQNLTQNLTLNKENENEKESNTPLTPFIKEKEKEKENLSQRTRVIVEEETISQDNIPYPLEQLTQFIRQRHQSWIETFCMNNNISLTIFNTLSDIFCTELQNRGDTSKTIKDYKHHFASWYKIQKDKQNATTSNNRQYSRSYQRQQQTRQRQAEIINAAQQLDALFEGHATGTAVTASVPETDGAIDLLQPESADYPFG